MRIATHYPTQCRHRDSQRCVPGSHPVGNATHARFVANKQVWSVDYKVVAFEKYTARLGTYDTFKIEGTLKIDGRLAFSTTRWYSPELRHVLSFRMIHATSDASQNNYWEISAIGERDG